MPAIFDTPIRTQAQNLDRVFATGRPVLLVFEIPDCEPCRALDPALKTLARDFAGRALIALVENATEGDLIARFRLTRAPTLLFWKDGDEIARIEGAAEAASVRAFLEYLLGGPRPLPAEGPSVGLGGTTGSWPGTRRGGSAQPGAGGRPGDAGSAGSVAVVNDATFQAQVLESPLPVLVDFWAPWCAPCRTVSPVVEELGRQYAGRLHVAKVNVDENPERAAALGIQGIPTLIVFRNGREVDRIVGAVSKETLVSHLEQVLKAY